MQSLPAAPSRLQPRPLPEHIQEATSRARAVGLSDSKQVTRAVVPQNSQLTRVTRLRRLVLGAGDEIEAAYQRTGHRRYTAMITLTYHDAKAWEPRDISRFMQRTRDWLARRGVTLRAIWVLELQKRGAPHYHVLVWLPPGVRLPKPDAAGWWSKGTTNIQAARKPVGYLAKYASKGPGELNRMPKGARIYGIYGAPTHLGWWRAPAWMRGLASKRMRVTRRRGGWWCVHDLAHAWRSPWTVVRIGQDGVEIEWVGWRNGDIKPLAELEAEQRLETRTCA